jgi:hypothetical protein
MISERRTLQNKSGEIYSQLVVKKVEKVVKVEKLKSREISGPNWQNLYIGYQPMLASQGGAGGFKLQRNDAYYNELHRRNTGPCTQACRARRGWLYRPAALRYSSFTKNFSIFTVLDLN